jgi:hypothetical protein
MPSNTFANLGEMGLSYSKPTADAAYYPPIASDPVRTNFRLDPFSGVSTASVQSPSAPSHSLLGLVLLGGIVVAFEYFRARKR